MSYINIDRKIFIITPRGGLCNQLITITNGIIYGHYFNRDIYFNGFQIDYKNNEYIDLTSILNLNKLNETINNLKLSTNILLDLNNNEHYKIENNDLSIKDLYKLIIEKNDIHILHIGNLINVNLPEDGYLNIINTINNSFEFSDDYIKKANLIKKSLNLSKYACVHLRLEDDALNYYSKHLNINIDDFNNITKLKYVKEFNDLTQFYENIYVCSSLIIQNNINNDFYKEIQNKYRFIDKNNFINKDDINKYRELYAIIDFIIAKDSDYFIGNQNSSFSYFINNFLKSSNKTSKLL